MTFDVKQLKIAKHMISEFGCTCIKVSVDEKNYMVFSFERNDKTRNAYVESKNTLYNQHK